jgi:hypothetical protein
MQCIVQFRMVQMRCSREESYGRSCGPAWPWHTSRDTIFLDISQSAFSDIQNIAFHAHYLKGIPLHNHYLSESRLAKYRQHVNHSTRTHSHHPSNLLLNNPNRKTQPPIPLRPHLSKRTYQKTNPLPPPHPPLHPKISFLAAGAVCKVRSCGSHYGSNSRNSDRECGFGSCVCDCADGDSGGCGCRVVMGVGQVWVEDVGEEGEEWGGAWG